MLHTSRANPAAAVSRSACLLVAVIGLGTAVPALSAAAPAAKDESPNAAIESSPAAVHGLTGTWNRYPQFGSKPDPKLPAPPPPVPPPPLKAQYKPDWDAKQQAIKEADARGEPPFTDYVKCLPDGMPTMMIGMFPMEVLQTPGQVTIMQEAYNQVRRVYLNEKQIPIEDAEPGYWGHSVGHWEGDTLIVDTVGIKQTVLFRGVPHSDQMRIHERIHMTTPDFFEDHITVEDPVYLTGPWSFTYAYTRIPHYKMLEYVCDSNREYKDPKTGGTRMRIGSH